MLFTPVQLCTFLKFLEHLLGLVLLSLKKFKPCRMFEEPLVIIKAGILKVYCTVTILHRIDKAIFNDIKFTGVINENCGWTIHIYRCCERNMTPAETSLPTYSNQKH